MSLRLQLLLLQVGIVMMAVVGVGIAATTMQAAQIRDSWQQQMVGVAQSVAQLPSVTEAYDDPDPALTIQPIAELIRESSGVTYVVVTDDQGIRYSHPDPELIGKKVSTDPSEPLSGKTYVGTQRGTLGESWRVKVPVRSADGSVIGTASVGILEAELRRDLLERVPQLLLWLLGAGLLGTIAAAWVSRLVWRRMYRLEPEEIAALLETREAMLHGIGEGVVAVDERGRLALVNDEAIRLLGLEGDVTGRPAREVLDPDVAVLLDPETTGSRLVLAGERILVGQRSEALVDGVHVGVLLILRDRTELHSVLRDLDGARDLTEALRAQAHEFANLMHVVSGLIELDRSPDAVEFIERSGYGGPLGAGALVPHVSDPGVSALLMAKTATSHERGVDLIIDPGSTLVQDDSGDVVTVLGNLIDNAVDATGTRGTVRVALHDDRNAVRITVEDDGPGIPAPDRERVFESGWSTKPDDRARGIGLALVGRLVARRGGSVEVGESADGGARFEVLLPHAEVRA